MFKIISILTVVTASLVLVTETMACTCGGPGPVDGAYAESANVVILKLRSLEKYPEAPTETTYSVGNIKNSILTVEKVFKGKLKIGQKLTFRQGGGADCVWTFAEED